MTDEPSLASSRSSDDLDNDDHDAGTTHEKANQQHQQETAPSPPTREEQAICFSKTLVYIVLTLAALAVSATTFMLTFNGEEDTFESEFTAHANEILSAAVENIRAKDSMMEALSVSFTSAVHMQNQTWPAVSMPDWEVQTAIARRNSGAVFVAFCPVIRTDQKEAWEAFSVANQEWVAEGLAIQGREPILDTGISPQVVPLEMNEIGNPGWYLPLWQQGPAPDNPLIVNSDTLTVGSVLSLGIKTLEDKQARLSDIVSVADFVRSSYSWYEEENKQAIEAGLARDLEEYEQYRDVLFGNDDDTDDADDFVLSAFDLLPYSFLLQPVFETLEEDAKVGGMLFVMFPWLDYFQGTLGEDHSNFLVYLDDHCGYGMTFTLDGSTAKLYGYEDAHDTEYDHLAVSANLASLAGVSQDPAMESTAECYVTMTVYPTRDLHHSYRTADPYVYAVVCLLIFVGTAVVFALYDYYMELRERKVEREAARTQTLVSSLFPKNVQERLLDEANKGREKDENNRTRRRLFRGKQHRDQQMMDFLDNNDQDAVGETLKKSKPIADLFPHTTILFCDLVGFTAWSASRAPEQVFILLETLYHNFDMIAKKRGVYKVETIGDCYVAVCGLPEPRKDHAVVMCKFARDCLAKMHLLIKELEAELGPDTSSLGMRFGLHSGSVVGGVLRSDRARFQLFGDTMNMASRMESNSIRNRIQVSEQTAEELRASGKASWLVPRPDKILAKGKGELQTYFVKIPSGSDKNSTRTSTSSEVSDAVRRNVRFCPDTGALLPPHVHNKTNAVLKHEVERLIEFNVSILKKPLVRLAAQRTKQNGKRQSEELRFLAGREPSIPIIDEAQDVIPFPTEGAGLCLDDTQQEELSADVTEQLRSFVQAVAACYKQKALHNFRYCSCSVMMAAQMIDSLEVGAESESDASVDVASVLRHPLVSFALLFAALLGNADHPGVSTEQLMAEQPSMSVMYKHQCLIQQNAFDIVWSVFMDERYQVLRGAIYATQEEFTCFRQTVIRCVLAMNIPCTDDNTAAAAMGRRFDESWDRAFAGGIGPADDTRQRDTRATLVLECIAAGANAFYCYQHNDDFIKWTEWALEEAMEAFASGRTGGSNPLDHWYESCAEFLDKISVPVVERLQQTGLLMTPRFAQLVEFAQSNQNLWLRHGEDWVNSYRTNFVQ